MPIFEIEAPDGTIFEVEAPEGATEEQVLQFASSNFQGSNEQGEVGVSTFVEPAITVATGAVAEPLAGLAGIAQVLNPFADEGAGAEAVRATREALTYKPKSQQGREGLQAVGEALRPIGEAIQETEEFLGNAVFDSTGSPTLAAAATTIPTVILETIGVGLGGKAAKRTANTTPSKRAIQDSLKQAAPTAENLRKLSRNVFTELDNSDVTIKPNVYSDAVVNIKKAAKKSGLSERTTVKAAGLVRDFQDLVGDNVPLSEVADLRKVAQGVANSVDRAEGAIGNAVLGEIDNFLDTLGEGSLVSGKIKASEIGKKYNAARNLWGRAAKSDAVADAIKNAKNQASGFENGLRVQFNSILKNKKKSKYFNANELKVMEDLVQGDVGQNFAKFIGKLGISEGRATNTLMTLLGGGAGGAVGGVGGAFVLPAVGQAGKVVAQKMTKNKAIFLDSLTRAGKDGEKIASAYLTTVPKAERNVKNLSLLLSDPNIDLTNLISSSDELLKEAAEIAAGRQVIGQVLGGVAATGGVGSINRGEK